MVGDWQCLHSVAVAILTSIHSYSVGSDAHVWCRIECIGTVICGAYALKVDAVLQNDRLGLGHSLRQDPPLGNSLGPNRGSQPDHTPDRGATIVGQSQDDDVWTSGMIIWRQERQLMLQSGLGRTYDDFHCACWFGPPR